MKTAADLEDVRELLPAVVLELADLIGYRHTLTLIERLGGVTFPVGKNIRHSGNRRADVLADTLPDSAVAHVVARFGGESLYIPRCAAALRELRNRRFLVEYHALRGRGESGRFALMLLCPRFGFSDRYAQRLIARNDSNDQLPLF